MGFMLPAGIVNTSSAFYYASNTTNEVGVLVKEPSEQVLVLIDYSTLEPPVTVTGASFSVDVQSNPELVVSYQQINSTQTVLTFLLSGGIAGQQYNLSITTQSGTQVLPVNIPSFDDCACARISPVPAQYNQLPLGTQAFVNTGTRYFWGNAPPANPGVMDQWWNPTTQTLYEWVTDGGSFFWETIASAGVVTDAPLSSILYARYNGAWVAEPIQADVTTVQFWCRQPGMWALHPIQSDAPSNNQPYVRRNGAWAVAPTAAIGNDAPSNDSIYGRMNGNWTMVPAPVIANDAPSGPNAYLRVAGAWQSGGTMTAPLIVQADLSTTANLNVGNNLFVGGVTTFNAQVALPYDPISPLQAATKQYVDNYFLPLDQAQNSYVQKSGSQMTGALLLYADPTVSNMAVTKNYVDNLIANTQVGAPFLSTLGGHVTGALTVSGVMTLGNDPVNPFEAATKKYVDDNTAGGIGDAPYTGNVYGRSSGFWVQALAITGGTLTGTLVLAADPTTNLQAATKQYVDNSVTTAVAAAPYVRTSGGVMTGLLTLSGPPTAANGAATKAYVDALAGGAAPLMDGNAAVGASALFARQDHVHPSDTSRVPMAGGTMTGLLILSGPPTVANGAATKAYADAMLPLAGGTMTGQIVLPSNPTMNLQAATKQYVDTGDANTLSSANTNATTIATGIALSAVAAAAGNYVQTNGSTMTGLLILSGDPVAALGAATKEYVDTPTNMTIDCGTF